MIDASKVIALEPESLETEMDVAVYALKVLEANDLSGWGVKFVGTKVTLGKCDYSTKVLQFSKYLLEDKRQVKLTVLHEVAHALAGYDAKHGDEWREICLALGGDGNRFGNYESSKAVTINTYYGEVTLTPRVSKVRLPKKLGGGFSIFLSELGRTVLVEMGDGRKARVPRDHASPHHGRRDKIVDAAVMVPYGKDRKREYRAGSLHSFEGKTYALLESYRSNVYLLNSEGETVKMHHSIFNAIGGRPPRD